jgi:hypothetical protein
MKNGKQTVVAALLVIGAMITGSATAQNDAATPGQQKQQWNTPDKPGDGVAEVVLADGADPMACRLSVSLKGGNSCTKVLCKGETAVFTNSVQSKLVAKRNALSIAKAHYVHFLQEEINSKRSVDMITSAIRKEGTADAGVSATSGQVTAESINERASELIKGFVVIEDGFTRQENETVAYVIGGVSCITQRGADTLKAGNKANMSNGGGAGSEPVNAPAANPSRRRAGVDQM